MAAKDLYFDNASLAKIKVGVDKLADAVKVTLGPRGRNVLIERGYGDPSVTKDGVSVAKEIDLKDPVENMGAQMVKSVAAKTADEAGDGPQPLYSKVLTPNGFTTMGELKVGDTICGTNNTFQEVLEVYPKGEKEIVKIHYADGRVAECCEDHVWNVTTHYGLNKVMTTKAMLELGAYQDTTEGNKRFNFYTPKTSVDFKESELPLDPYLVGVLLGDGSISSLTPHDASIEISLGARKEHVIAKLALPTGFSASSKWVESKNYYRVKITGKGTDGESFHEALQKLGILGTTSTTKHIPHGYLYSSVETRSQLLQGLLDTDGYINTRGLFEFSTVSDQLKEDFSSLCLSLGRSINYRLHTRDNDAGSYSDRPIHRFSELKGYKYGDKIVHMERTGNSTTMQCIKVSNPDSLYITDGYVVTHNTTTATVLAQAIFAEGYKMLTAGSQAVELKRGMDKVRELLVKEIKDMARPVSTKAEMAAVATISANNESELGELIANAIDAVGKNGIVTIDEASSGETRVDLEEGFEFPRGWKDTSRHFTVQLKDGSETIELLAPNILYYSKDLNSVGKEFQGTLEAALASGQPLVLVAPNFSNTSISFLVANLIKGNQLYAMMPAGFASDDKMLHIEDMAAATGGNIYGPGALPLPKGGKDEPVDLGLLGGADKIIIGKGTTTIIGGQGDPEEIKNRVKTLQDKVENTASEFDKEKLQERIGRLSGGIAVIRVCGNSEVEIKEKKDRVEDALHATRAAAEGGIVPGGGVTLLLAKAAVEALPDWGCINDDQKTGGRLLLKALEAPIRCIVSNAGGKPDVVLEKITKGEASGYNAHTDTYEDMLEAGVVDPAKVTISALTNAVSIAGMLLTTSCSITIDRGMLVPDQNQGM